MIVIFPETYFWQILTNLVKVNQHKTLYNNLNSSKSLLPECNEVKNGFRMKVTAQTELFSYSAGFLFSAGSRFMPI